MPDEQGSLPLQQLAERKDDPEGWALLGVLIRDYQWFHIGLGLIGNTSFVIGSILFFWEKFKQPAIWLFVVGSTGMLVASIGRAIVQYEEERERPDSPVSNEDAVRHKRQRQHDETGGSNDS